MSRAGGNKIRESGAEAVLAMLLERAQAAGPLPAIVLSANDVPPPLLDKISEAHRAHRHALAACAARLVSHTRPVSRCLAQPPRGARLGPAHAVVQYAYAERRWPGAAGRRDRGEGCKQRSREREQQSRAHGERQRRGAVGCGPGQAVSGAGGRGATADATGSGRQLASAAGVGARGARAEECGAEEHAEGKCAAQCGGVVARASRDRPVRLAGAQAMRDADAALLKLEEQREDLLDRLRREDQVAARARVSVACMSVCGAWCVRVSVACMSVCGAWCVRVSVACMSVCGAWCVRVRARACVWHA